MANVVYRDKVEGKLAMPGLVRRILTHSADLMLVENDIAAGTVLPMHAHPHEQIIYVQSGELRVTCQGEVFVLQAGDSCVAPSNQEHGAVALKDSIVMDIFTPRRDDFLE